MSLQNISAVANTVKHYPLYNSEPPLDTTVRSDVRGHFFIGTSGLLLPYNKAQFPEPFHTKSRLNFYSSIFNSVEINSSFYKLPLPATFKKWKDEAMPDFKFTVKLSRAITHSSALEYNTNDLEKFLNAAGELEEKKGCLLVQIPPVLQQVHFDKLFVLLNTIKSHSAGGEWQTCVEFRHSSWYNETVYRVLEKLGVSMVLHDMPGSAPVWSATNTAVVYLRLHGPKGDYRGSYTESFLSGMSEKINHWLKASKDVYVYFNNTIGTAFNDASVLQEMFRRKE